MMSKSKSPLSRGWRVLYLLPLVCLGIGLQARTVYVPVDKDSEKIPAEEQFNYFLPEVVVMKYADASVKPEDVIHVNRVNEIKMTAAKDFDTAPECSENFARWLNSRLRYPADCLYDGTLVAMFVVGEDGKVGNVEIVSGLCEELDKSVADLIGKSPEWTPAKKDGKAVATVLFQPVIFKIRTSTQTAQASPVIEINVRADGSIESGGQVYSIGQLKDIVPAHQEGQPQNTVQIVAEADVPMGRINDVKQILRGIESLKVRYALPADRSGVTRYMAPLPPTPTQKNKVYGVTETFPGVDRKDVFVVRINSHDKVFFGDAPRQDEAEMLRVGKDFLSRHGKATRFALQTDRAASFGAYVHMQNLLLKIYEEVREEKAQSVYDKSLEDLSAEERSLINDLVPLSISETDMNS